MEHSDGPLVFAHACKLGLEGILSKRKDTRLSLPAWICSLPVVSKRTSSVPTSLFRWRVIRLRGSPAMWVGDVDAPDEPSAIEEAIKIYNITDREHQRSSRPCGGIK